MKNNRAKNTARRQPPHCCCVLTSSTLMLSPSTYCGVPCGEYRFDHRNGSMLQQWFIDEFVGGPHGIDNPAIDGFFFDDNFGSHGTSEEDPNNVEDCGLTPAEAEAVATGWRANSAAVGKAVLAKGGFAVPFFQSPGRNETDPKSHCAADLRRLVLSTPPPGGPASSTRRCCSSSRGWTTRQTLGFGTCALSSDPSIFVCVHMPHPHAGRRALLHRTLHRVLGALCPMQRPNNISRYANGTQPYFEQDLPRSSSPGVCTLWNEYGRPRFPFAFRPCGLHRANCVVNVSICQYVNMSCIMLVLWLVVFLSRPIRMDRVHLVWVHRLGIPRGLRPEVQCGRLQAVPVPQGPRLAPVRATAGARRRLRHPHRLLQGDGRRRVRAGVDRGDGLARLQRLNHPHHQTRCPGPAVKISRSLILQPVRDHSSE